ncbi:hypothetical protein ABIA23_004694 [Sinorhizobium fredii]
MIFSYALLKTTRTNTNLLEEYSGHFAGRHSESYRPHSMVYFLPYNRASIVSTNWTNRHDLSWC